MPEKTSARFSIQDACPPSRKVCTFACGYVLRKSSLSLALIAGELYYTFTSDGIGV